MFCLRLVLAVVFAVAGISKLLAGFPAVRKSLGDFGISRWLLAPVAICLPAIELTTAVLLLLSQSAWIGSITGLALLLIFNASIITNLAVGKTPNCNCFGQLHSKPIGWSTFGRNAAFASAAGLLCWQLPKYRYQSLLNVAAFLSRGEIAALIVGIAGFAGLLVEAFFVLHVLRQNGRLLIRIEALERAKSTVNQVIGPNVPMQGIPVGQRAVPFQLPTLQGTTASLNSFLDQQKPALLIFTDPNCGPCNELMPEVAGWQKAYEADINVVMISSGRHDVNRAKAKEFELVNVLIEKKRRVAERYHAFGTPSAVIIRQNGDIGSPVIGGADAIRRLVLTRGWTDAGYAAFVQANAQPQPVSQSKPTLPLGSRVPAFTLPDLSGSNISSAQFNGNGTLLLFWNPGCGFCQRMLSELKDWERAKRSSAPALVLISGGSVDANRAMGLQSMILMDDKFSVAQMFGANGTPSGVLIDDRGDIASALAVGAPGVMGLMGGGSDLRQGEAISRAS